MWAIEVNKGEPHGDELNGCNTGTLIYQEMDLNYASMCDLSIVWREYVDEVCKYTDDVCGYLGDGSVSCCVNTNSMIDCFLIDYNYFLIDYTYMTSNNVKCYNPSFIKDLKINIKKRGNISIY